MDLSVLSKFTYVDLISFKKIIIPCHYLRIRWIPLKSVNVK